MQVSILLIDGVYWFIKSSNFDGIWKGNSNIGSSVNDHLPEGVYFYNLNLGGQSFKGYIYKK